MNAPEGILVLKDRDLKLLTEAVKHRIGLKDSSLASVHFETNIGPLLSDAAPDELREYLGSEPTAVKEVIELLQQFHRGLAKTEQRKKLTLSRLIQRLRHYYQR